MSDMNKRFLIADPVTVLPKRVWAKFCAEVALMPVDLLLTSERTGVRVLFHRVDASDPETRFWSDQKYVSANSGLICIVQLIGKKGKTHRWNNGQQGLRFDTLEQALEIYTRYLL